MARFHLPNHLNTAAKKQLAEYVDLQFHDNVHDNRPAESDEGSQYCLDLNFYTMELTEEEQMKHEFYEGGSGTVESINGGAWTVEKRPEGANDSLVNILERLNADDLRLLMETEDELSEAKGYGDDASSFFTFSYGVYHLL